MSLNKWLGEGRLRIHKSSAQEVSELFRVVDRDIDDAHIRKLSADRRFTTSYNAALQLATIALRVSGYRSSGAGHHWVTFQMLPTIMGSEEQNRADYFDACRRKRNTADYDTAGEISDSEAAELYAEVLSFRHCVLNWMRRNYLELLSDEITDRV